jgi:hypothetical protein
MFNNPRARLQRTKVIFEDYRYQLYVDGKNIEQIETPYHIWRKYYLAEKRFDLFRARVERVVARGNTPSLKLLINYYQAVRDYMSTKIELEIYYYGNDTPKAKNKLIVVAPGEVVKFNQDETDPAI